MGKKSKPPPTPDYTALAEKTAETQRQAAQAQTIANRPNQTDIYGNTSTWTQDAGGNWTQTQKMSDQNQALYDQQQQIRAGMMGQVTDALGTPLSTEGLPEYSNYNFDALQGVDVGNLGGGQFTMDPIGNAKAIQDATYGLIQPQRAQAREAEVQRLKSQGISEDSAAFQRAVGRLDTGDTEAQLRSLLAGTQEYGNQFNRALQQNQSNFGQNADTQRLAMALRGQQFGEQGAQAQLNAQQRGQMLNEQQFIRQAPVQDLASLIQLQSGYAPQFGQFASATGSQGVDYTGAAQKGYEADVAATNAKNASKSALTSGILTAVGGAFGGPMGAALGGAIGGGLSSGSQYAAAAAPYAGGGFMGGLMNSWGGNQAGGLGPSIYRS